MVKQEDEVDAQRDSIGEMMSDCESMQDEIMALQVRSAVAHDEVVISLVPFLLALSLHEEDASISRR
ncbi:unnamed protein product, partial [Ectocarpus sp. 8 AP-2014]